MLKLLEKYVSNPDDSAHALAVELQKELTNTFNYILDPSHPDFCPEFIVATFLAPEYKWMMKPEHKPVIRKYLEGKFIQCRVKPLSKMFIIREGYWTSNDKIQVNHAQSSWSGIIGRRIYSFCKCHLQWSR